MRRDHTAADWYAMGVAQRHAGRGELSYACFMRALQLDPGNPTFLRLAGMAHTCVRDDELYVAATAALGRAEQYPAAARVELHYAAGKALEDVGEIATAFEHYAKAGAIQKQLHPWSEEPLRKLLDLFKELVTPEIHADRRQDGVPTKRPVFVFGFPRSGTTLVEQIVAKHSQAHGLGEIKTAAAVLNGIRIGRTRIDTGQARRDLRTAGLWERGQAYLKEAEALAGPRPARVVDKMPGNFAWLGLLDAMLPGSYFIHCERDPADACLSAYKLYFGNEVPYSYDLADLARMHRLLNEYIPFWSSILPDGRILTVRYEDLVTDYEANARRIIDFVELPWEERCLIRRDTNTIRTASALQVRQPVHTRSIGRWRKEAAFLAPLLAELGERIAL